MYMFICMHCRQDLYLEGEEEVQCVDHPWSPADKVPLIVEESVIEEEPPVEGEE